MNGTPPIQAYFVLDEFLLGGMVQETSKKQVNKAIASADMLQEVSSGFCIGPLPPSCVGVGGGGRIGQHR